MYISRNFLELIYESFCMMGSNRGAMLVKTLFHWILMEASDHLFPWKEILNSVAPSMSPFLIPVHHITIDLLVQQGEILPK